MDKSTKDAGIIQVLAERLEKQRLPRLLAIKEMVDRGEVLGEFDIEFLQEALHDASQNRAFIEAHPDWHDLAGRIVQLYKDITAKALENEKLAKDG